MRTNPRAILAAQGLERHRQRDHLSKEIVQSDQRTPEPARFEIFPETDARLGEPSRPFGISGFAPLLGLQHEPKLVAKRMTIALGAAAAFEREPAGQSALQQDAVTDTAGFEVEFERPLGVATVAFGGSFS